MTPKETIIRYLTRAQACVDSAIKTTEAGDSQAAQVHILRAIFQLRAANKLIIQEHIARCVPKIMKEISINQGIEEIIKTHKYIPS